MNSIIIPIHDMRGRLHSLRESIDELPFEDIEIILIDDVTSPEASLEIESLIVNAPSRKIKLVKGSYGSPGAARNAGLSEATGQWIIFVDSDDRLYAKEMFKYLKSCEQDQIQVFQFRKIEFTSGKVLEQVSQTENIFDLVFNLGLWRMAFPSVILTETRFSNLKMGEDILFFLDVIQSRSEIKFVPLHTYDYVIGLGNQLTKNADAIEDIVKLLDGLRQKNFTNREVFSFLRLMYFKNALSAVKHLGLMRSKKYIGTSAKMIIKSKRDDKRRFLSIAWRLLKR